jgi:hypothetical protein
MSLPNPNKPVTEKRLQEFYHRIKNYLGIPEMPSEDMEEILTPLPSVISRRMKYSTEEQIVGEWIDGKPIYQITVNVNSATVSGTELMTVTNVTNVKKVISLDYQTILKDTSSFDGLVYSQSGYSRLRSNIDNGVIQLFHLCTISTWLTNSSIDNIYATLQYTKTTD